MKYMLAISALALTAIAMPTDDGHKKSQDEGDKTVCESHQTVVCDGNGDGGLVSLGNLLSGLLGESCSGGDVYCCDSNDVAEGLIAINLDLSCSLNHLL